MSSSVKMTRPTGRELVYLIVALTLAFFAIKKCNSSSASNHAAANTIATPPTLNDTLTKSEIKAVVFLKMEYGIKREDIDMAAQSWYPAKQMEVVKWRIRNGMQHLMVVTQTRLNGTDFKDAANWDVKIVNKFSE